MVEYLILSKLREKFGTIIVTAGDPNQRGKNLEIAYNSEGFDKSQEIGFNIDYVYGFTNIRLLSSIRALNSLVKSNTDKAFTLQRTVKEIEHGLIQGSVGEYVSEAKEVGLLELAYEDLDGKLNGHIITNELGTYLSKIPKDGTIGILTKDGKLEDDIDALLLKEGLRERVKIFSLNNLQGNETDYFIFDAKLLGVRFDFDSYYTFITRAKKGTIIVDTEGKLEKMGFTNVYKKSYEIEPLTKELIKEATDNRKSILDKLNKGVDGTLAWLRLTQNTEEDSSTEEDSTETSVSKKDLSDRLQNGAEEYFNKVPDLDPLLNPNNSTEQAILKSQGKDK